MKRFRIECGVSQPSATDAIAMDVQGAAKNVKLRIDYITRPMLRDVPDLLIDLLEVAAYVYCADQRLGRGSDKLTNFGENWRRCLHFSIPVRELQVWQDADVHQLLAETLGFLSDDSYTFEFRKADAPVQPKEFYFPNLIDASMEHDEVALFSGGVDSFAGAVDDILINGTSVTLVGHYSSTKVRNVQETLINALKNRGFDRSVSYIPVWMTNEDVAAREFSQRTRSFLFACLGLVVARMSGKDHFSFYENGVVSINLPLAGDVIGGRATRTTNPKVLRGLEELFSMLLDHPIHIRTPLQWLTKSEVVLKIQEAGTLAVRCAPATIDRAMRIMDALIRAGERRGWTFLKLNEPNSVTRFQIGTEVVGLSLEEKHKKIRHIATAEEIAAKRSDRRLLIPLHDRVPAGRLVLEIADGGAGARQRSWADSSVRRLETVLNDVALEIFAAAEYGSHRAPRTGTFARERDAVASTAPGSGATHRETES